MAKRKDPIKNSQARTTKKDTAYVSWDYADPIKRDKALAQYGDAITDFSYASIGSRGRDFSDLTTRISGKPGLTQADFDWFRPSSRIPTESKEIIAFARSAYRKIGLIRNAVDLMGDFACQGVRLVHPNRRIEQFYNEWFSRVNGKIVSERICNLLFREANVPIRSKTAKVNKRKRNEMQRSVASPDMEAVITKRAFSKAEIPWQFTFLDPLLIDVVGGNTAGLVGEKLYRMGLPTSLQREINKLRKSADPAERALLAKIPPDILQAAEKGGSVLLPSDKTYMLHYKKDDWQQWADPMTYACFKDLRLYEKLKLADEAALDGAVNKIRVWKLGSLEHKLAPTPNAASALGEILGANVGGGTVDIVWGPDIELIETGTDVQRFLGEEKYRPTLTAIYSCLGIPPTLTGTSGAGGTTNNLISLKTLAERLNYVRNNLTSFWKEQIKIVQEAMGFRLPAEIEYDFMYLEDPASMTQLMINLADRNIISDEFVQRNIKATPSVERKRMNNESKIREKTGVEKVSPYHAVDKEFALEKIALQTGIVSPTQVGVKLDEKKEGDQSVLEMNKVSEKDADKKKQMELPFDKGNPNSPKDNGRPKNSQDTGPRKKREFKPRNRASIELWAKNAQEKISEFLNPAFLQEFNKKNMRSLSSEEAAKSESIKFEVLCNIDPGEEVTIKAISSAINSTPIPKKTHNECDSWISEASEDMEKRLNIEEIRNLRAAFYVYLKENQA
jgi:hypothetical protein|tara:strand:+ start:1378 stop:3570 length:2193 start_codon:yes stop_codon:yes gene_type:complete